MNKIFDELPQELHLLDLPQSMAGFRCFVSSWFFVDSKGRRVVVDPGPASSIPALLEKLASVTDEVDLILLTHIHIDHSGGVGHLCDRYRSAKVVAHPKACRNLSSPEKLWQASLATLGDVAVMYEEPKPLAPEKLVGYDCEILSGIEVLETPGHAPHHITFILPFNGDRLVFVGESMGSRAPVKSGVQYLRPATPPKLDLPTMHESLAKLESGMRGDELLCYGHWGAARDPKTRIAAAGKQLNDWLGVISGMKDRAAGEIVEYLISNDPFLAGYSSLPEDVRSRERFFIQSSVEGFLGYLRDAKNGKK